MTELPVERLQQFIETAGAAPVLLDVREPWERSLASLEVAGRETLAIPMNEIPARVAEIDAARPVLCLCHHGMRSAMVGRWLEQAAGHPSVYNLSGGIDAWSTTVDPAVPRY